MGKISLLIALILFMNSANSLIISEIMYNPEGNDEGREWIEIYNDGSEKINLSKYRFFENGVKHRLKFLSGEVLDPGEFGIIADNAENFLAEYNFSLEDLIIADSSFSLKNSGEYIAILNESQVVVFETEYENLAESGKSLCYSPQGYYECAPTPGEENLAKSAYEKDENSCDFDLEAFTSEGYYIFIIKEESCKRFETYELELEEFTEFGKMEKRFNGKFKCKEILKEKISEKAESAEAEVIALSCNDTEKSNNFEKLRIIGTGLNELVGSSEEQKINLDYEISGLEIELTLEIYSDGPENIELKFLGENNSEIANSLFFDMDNGFRGKIRSNIKLLECSENAKIKVKSSIKNFEIPIKVECPSAISEDIGGISAIIEMIEEIAKMITSI